MSKQLGGGEEEVIIEGNGAGRNNLAAGLGFVGGRTLENALHARSNKP